MGIRILTREELPQAVELARFVFNTSLRSTVQSQESVADFEKYVCEDNLAMLMEQENLVLWGVSEDNRIVAVSGMQRDGLITLLYVLPAYRNRGYGRLMLRTMRAYAKGSYRLAHVAVNVMPAWTAQYFRRQGFQVSGGPPVQGMPFVPMWANTLSEIFYEKKRIPVGWFLGTSLGGLFLCLLAAVIYMVHYLF